MSREIKKVKSKIHFVNNIILKVSMSTLIINIELIEKHFKSVDEFALQNKLWGCANDKLFILTEMNEPAWDILKIMDQTLIPLGLKEDVDFKLVYESLLEGVSGKPPSPKIGKEIQGCEDVEWLSSYVSIEGHFIWYRSTKTKFKLYADLENELRSLFIDFSNQDLINSFNSEVDSLPNSRLRNAYAIAIRKEFQNREVDFSLVGDNSVFRLDRKLLLRGNTILAAN